MNSRREFDIAIVGGGIAGLCLALSLHTHTSISFTLYEAAPAFGEIGAGVAFGPNAVRAMSLISDELVKRFQARATQNLSPSKKGTWFDYRIGQDGKTEEAQRRGVKAGEYLCTVPEPEPHSGLINRAHYLEILVALLPNDFARFGKVLTNLEHLGDTGVRLQFEDGTDAIHCAVIGCDGIKSQIRKFMAGDNYSHVKPTFTGKYCYRGMIPMQLAIKELGEELAQNSQAYLGYHGHMLTFPVAGGKMMNVVAFNSKKEWTEERMVIPATKEEMLQDYVGWGKQVESIIKLMNPSDIWALFDHPPIDTYADGRVCLVGDAAHASTPFQGAGAGMAVEDAYVMGRVLKEAKNASHLTAAFKTFDILRRARTQRLVSTSRESGHLWHFELEGDDIEKIKKMAETRMRWIWEYDFDREIDLALQDFRASLQVNAEAL